MNSERKIRIQENIIKKQDQVIEQLNQTIDTLIIENNRLREQLNVEGLVVSEMMDDLVSKRNELNNIVESLNKAKGQYQVKATEIEDIRKSYKKQMNKLVKSMKKNNR